VISSLIPTTRCILIWMVTRMMSSCMQARLVRSPA
jgi:hypothetical protein